MQGTDTYLSSPRRTSYPLSTGLKAKEMRVPKAIVWAGDQQPLSGRWVWSDKPARSGSRKRTLTYRLTAEVGNP